MPEPAAITALIITYNEQDNIARTLNSIAWVDRIVVVDSGSSDNTLGIVAGYPNATVFQRTFTTFAEQCNFGLAQVATPWVLSIDADYLFPADAELAIRQSISNDDASAYAADFSYAIHGRIVKGSILPGRTIVYCRDVAHYEDDGHGHKVVIEGPVGILPFRVIHDDRKPLQRWLTSQVIYAEQEASKLQATALGDLDLADQLRRFYVVAPVTVFLLVYVLRGGFMSGWHGLFYALQRFYAELLLSLFLIDRRLRPRA